MSVSRSVRVAAAAALAVSPALATLSPDLKLCGDHTCLPRQYCSTVVDQCRNCSDICTQGKNYQQDRCRSECQDYLHHIMYEAKDGAVQVAAAMSRLEGDVHRLTIMVSVMFCLFIVCFIGLAAFAWSSYRKACRRRKTADLESNSIELKKIGAKLANGLAAPEPAPAAPPVISPKSDTVPQWSASGRLSLSLGPKPGEEEKRALGRHPSEDTCPGDYSRVYDNPALVMTPPGAAAGAGRPASGAGSSLYSRDSFRPAGSAPSSGRRPREVDITDPAPANTVGAY